MRKSAIAAVGVGVVLALGVSAVCRDAARRPSAQRYEQQYGTNAAPEDILGPLHASSRAKREAALRVIRERLPLLEAAGLFRAANGSAGLQRLRTALPGETVLEQLCRQVISYVAAIEAEPTGPVPEGPAYTPVLAGELEQLRADGQLVDCCKYY